MGKRRIRNLRSNGVDFISGFDIRDGRREEVKKTYGVPVFKTLEEAISHTQYDAWVISVPPHLHHIYMKEALQNNVPAFIEASVVDTDMDAIIKIAKEKKILLLPSCTLFFHPAINRIGQIVRQGTIGKLSNFLYHSGQYLPDWHTYEKVSDYYVSNKATGGGREIVPFELTWITMLLGFPKRIASFYKKTIDIEGAQDISDTYNILMDYDDFLFSLCVDVVSRNATRRLVINGDQKQLYWDWTENAIKLFNPLQQEWEIISYEMRDAHRGYNKNITETMYDDEVNAVLNTLLTGKAFPNTLENDHRVLQLLYAAERSSDTNQIQLLG